MRLLAIETATGCVGVAVGSEDGPMAASWVAGGRRHAESLAPMVEEVCRHAGMSVGDIDVIAVDVGPGLFTGLRVGVAMANGLGMSLGIGVMGAQSLEVLAQAAADSGWCGDLAAVVDARRGQVFLARFTVGADGVPRSAGDPVRTEADAVSGLLATAHPPVLAIGDGALRYSELLGVTPNVRLGGAAFAAPPPATLASMAISRARDRLPQPGIPVFPLYLRAPDINIGWVQRGSR